MIKHESEARGPKNDRGRASLNPKLDKNLLAYAVAASAACVSLLALAQPAEAKIVYTKASIEIAPGKMLNLDLNHDGNTDFSFSNRTYQYVTDEFVATLKIAPSGRNGVVGSASALVSGVQVGSKDKFQQDPQRMVQYIHPYCSRSRCGTQTFGAWKNITNGYLGLKFFIHGKAHYGWARLNVTVTSQGVYGLLTGYAYETIANKAILTGKTKGNENQTGSLGNSSRTILSDRSRVSGTLGQLAQGAALWK